MKEYVGVITVSFDLNAYSREDLQKRIKEQLGVDLILEDVEIDTVYTDGYDPFDEADRINDEKKTLAH